MADLANCPVHFQILYQPAGRGGGDVGGFGASLAFHIGKGTHAAAQPTDLHAFLEFIGGLPETVLLGGVEVVRIVPLRHPWFPSMVAVACRWDGMGKPMPSDPGWTDWRVIVDFAVVPYDFGGGDQPYMTIRRRYGASAITLPGQAFRVGGVALNHDVAMVMPEILYSFTKYNVPTLDDTVFKLLSGKINASPFLGYPSETVRFDGVEDEITQTIALTINRTVSLSIAWRPVSWNLIMAPSGEWVRPINAATGAPIYQTGNFDLLYQ
jgi:hypothetical protein